MIARAAYEAAHLFRIPRLLRQIRDRAVILCYHNVTSAAPSVMQDSGLGAVRDTALHMNIEQFERQIIWICREFDVVGLDELISRLGRHDSVRGLACITFDDGYTGFFRRALPLLRSRKIPSAVFLVTKGHETQLPYWWDHPDIVRRASSVNRERWLRDGMGDGVRIASMEGIASQADLPDELLPASFSEIRENLGPDLTVGAHTSNHRCLTTLDESDLRRELAEPVMRIQDELGVRPRYLAYPYGDWDARVRDAAEVAGYEACLTLDMGLVTRNRPDVSALPRVNIPGGMPDAAFQAWVSGVFPPHA